jgi:hypothetical protein
MCSARWARHRAGRRHGGRPLAGPAGAPGSEPAPSVSTFPVGRGSRTTPSASTPRDKIGAASRQLLAFSADGLKMSHLPAYEPLLRVAAARGSGDVTVDQPLFDGSGWRLGRLASSRALAGALRGD